jgi:hypothetical protein
MDDIEEYNQIMGELEGLLREIDEALKEIRRAESGKIGELKLISSIVLKINLFEHRFEKRIENCLKHDKHLTQREKNELNRVRVEVLNAKAKLTLMLKTRHLEKIGEVIEEEEKSIKEAELKIQWEERKLLHSSSLKDVCIRLESGDIIGQGIDSRHNPGLKIIELVSRSRFNHVGIIDIGRNWFGRRKVFVIQATDPHALRTPIKDFIEPSHNKYAVYRHKNLTEAQKKIIIKKSREWAGKWRWFYRGVKDAAKRYDHGLMPGEEELTCSELVYEAYKAAGIEFQRDISIDSLRKNLAYYIKEYYGRQDNTAVSYLQGLGLGKGGFYNEVNMAEVKKFGNFIISPEKVLRHPGAELIFRNM